VKQTLIGKKDPFFGVLEQGC